MKAHSSRPPGLDRDVALFALLVGVVGVLLAVVAVLNAAATLVTALSGGPWEFPAFVRWFPHAAQIVIHPGQPGTGLGPPWQGGLRDQALLYWVVTGLVLALGTLAVLGVARPVWRLLGPTPPGHASRHDLRTTLSLWQARTTARWTRPSLTDQQRRAAPLEEIAVPLHRGPNKQRLCTSLETPTGTIAPTRSGKSRTDLIHKVLAAPGAMLASTTKPDLAEWGLLARARREGPGPVYVFDATYTVSWPALIKWSPIVGCHDPNTALRRAESLVEASSVGLRDVVGNDKVFRERAKIVIQAYLLAAALAGRHVGDLVGWAITKPPDLEPVDILRAHHHPDLAGNLRSEVGMVAETSDAVWMSVRRTLEPWMNAHLRHMSSPTPGQHFDVDQFLAEQGSLFLIAGEHQAPQARPILTALTDHILTTAQDKALTQHHRRLDPPFTAVLDELYDATPVPRLPGILADSAGRGVLIHWAAQSVAQLEELYDQSGRRQLLDNTLTLTAFGGLKDDKTLEWLSTLAGQHRRRTYQQHSDGLFGVGRTAVGTETAPTYRPGDIRTLRRGRVLVLHANLLPILARTVDVADRPDGTQLAADVTTIRTGTAPIGSDGRLLSTTPAGNATTIGGAR